MSTSLPAASTAATASLADATHDHRLAPVEERSYRLGSAAALVSSLCAVHCLVTPLAAGVLPLVGLGFFASELFEWGMLAFSALIGVVGFGLSFWHLHNNARPFAVFIAGIATLAMTHLLLEGSALLHGTMVVVGAAVIWQAGRMNHAAVHACQRCHPHPHRH